MAVSPTDTYPSATDLGRERAHPRILTREFAVVLSGGGIRVAYQVGALSALCDLLDPRLCRVIIGSSIGAVNVLVLAASIRSGLEVGIEALKDLWRVRTYANTFVDKPSLSFLRALKMGMLQYFSPGPKATSTFVFNPKRVIDRTNALIEAFGGAGVSNFPTQLHAVGVMTTREGASRKGLLLATARSRLPEDKLFGVSFDVVYLDRLSAEHAFASAALPSILPPVQISLETEEVRLVDGGISDNFPIDPALRFGAEEVLLLDASGRKWWFDHYRQPYDFREPWEVIGSAGTFCHRPERLHEFRSERAFGPILKKVLGKSTRGSISALGPLWPVFRLLKHRLGEELAYEVMSYAVLHEEYIDELIELGYQETAAKLRALAEDERETQVK